MSADELRTAPSDTRISVYSKTSFIVDDLILKRNFARTSGGWNRIFSNETIGIVPYENRYLERTSVQIVDSEDSIDIEA